MDLSVVIVSYNTKEVLSDCLKTVKSAIQNLKSEVFVVDNSSHDQTVKMIKKDFPWVKLIANKKNLGFSKANNQAIKKSNGKYILILNPDTKVLNDTFSKMIDFMEKSPEVAVSTCRVELLDGSLDPDCRRSFPTPWRSFTHFSGLSKIFKGSKIFDQYNMGYLSEEKEQEVDACVGAFMMVRRTAVDKVGLFDEDFFFYGEDLDWCWRFGEKGYKIMYTPITKIIHYKGASSGIKKGSQEVSKATAESKRKALVESTRAMTLFYEKHFKDKYPFFITWLVLIIISIVKQIRLFGIRGSTPIRG